MALAVPSSWLPVFLAAAVFAAAAMLAVAAVLLAVVADSWY